MSDEIIAYQCDKVNIEQEDDEKCSHLQTSDFDGSTICIICGEKIDELLVDNEVRYYGINDTRYCKDPNRHNQRKQEDRSLYADLEAFGFPLQVIERANNYYKKIIENSIYRAGNRMAIVFACTFHAYSDIHEPRDPIEFAKIFKLDKKGISNGLKIFSATFPKRPGKHNMSPMDLVPKLLDELKIEQKFKAIVLKDINYIYDCVKKKSKSLISSNPRSIAAGLIYFYLKLLDEEKVNRSSFSKVVKLTDITYTKIANDIHISLKIVKDIRY